MGTHRNPLVAGAGVLVLAGALSWEGASASAQGNMGAGKEAVPFGVAEKAVVGGVPMSLYTEVWRGAREMNTTTVVRVIAGGEKFPERVTLEKVWFRNGDERVEASLLPEVVPAPSNEQIRWAHGVADPDGDGEVDLILQLRDAGGGRHLLKADRQPVRNLP